VIPEVEELLNELKIPILPGNRQRPWEFPVTAPETASQDIINYCPNYTTSTADAPEEEQDEEEEEPITGTDRSLEIRCYNASSSSIPPESFVEILGAYPLGSDVVLLVTVPTEDALELAGITTTFLTPAGSTNASGWCRIAGWAALRYTGASGDYIGTKAGETHGTRGSDGSVQYVGDIEAGRAVVFFKRKVEVATTRREDLMIMPLYVIREDYIGGTWLPCEALDIYSQVPLYTIHNFYVNGDGDPTAIYYHWYIETADTAASTFTIRADGTGGPILFGGNVVINGLTLINSLATAIKNLIRAAPSIIKFEFYLTAADAAAETNKIADSEPGQIHGRFSCITENYDGYFQLKAIKPFDYTDETTSTSETRTHYIPGYKYWNGGGSWGYSNWHWWINLTSFTGQSNQKTGPIGTHADAMTYWYRNNGDVLEKGLSQNNAAEIVWNEYVQPGALFDYQYTLKRHYKGVPGEFACFFVQRYLGSGGEKMWSADWVDAQPEHSHYTG